MIVPGSANPLLLGDAGYNIQRSLRFRSSASAYLSRTPASNGSTTTATISFWVKRGALNSSGTLGIFGAGNTNKDGVQFWNDNIDVYFVGGASYRTTTVPVYRDPSAWMHVVVSLNTTQATAANRVTIYVNGSLVTATTGTMVSQNYGFSFGSAQAHSIGRDNYSAYFDGYLSDFYYIDGQALTPSSFGQTDPVTGVWQPKKYGGTYGTNGFYLPFSDNTSATTLAYDKSGNSNNWTPTNISTTAGITYDSMTDVPTLTSATAANYCVLNPLTKGSSITISNGNLDAVGSVNTNTGNTVLGSIDVSSGKWYAEFKVQNTYSFSYIGVADPANPGSYPGANSAGYSMEVGSGATYNVAAGPTITGAVAGDTVMVALDMDNGKIWWGKNGTWGGTGNPSAGTGQQFSGLTGTKVFMLSAYSSSGTFNANFGQRPFSYTPPTGFVALNTFNLPDPTIKKPNQYMDATTWTGNGGTLAVTNSGSMQPDFVWVKNRSYAGGSDHVLIDSVRGKPGLGYATIASNSTAAEVALSTQYGYLSNINSNGFTVVDGTDSVTDNYNQSGMSYVGWQWKKGATPGFDIVTFTGTGAAQNISHSLGVAPSMMIVKQRGAVGDWWTYHKNANASPQNGALWLNLTNAWTGPASYWNNTAPTSSVFTVGTAGGLNANGVTQVAYLFAEIPGFSKFGSYTGNGSTDGAFCYTGFRPKWIMVKCSSSGENWYIEDSVRGTYNPNQTDLFPNLSSAEITSANYNVDFTANGFKIRTVDTSYNSSGQTYIFCAFAENPFKYSNAR